MTDFFEEMKRFATILILLLLFFSSCYDNHEGAQSTDLSERDNCDISQLLSRCQEGVYLVTTDMVCECRVTSSDREGNFYRSIVVEDCSGGAEIKLGIHNTASQYPVGLTVKLRLNGTAIMLENGVMQVGLPPQPYDDSPREMVTKAVIEKHILRTDSVNPVEPLSCDIASLNTSICGRFIAIDNLRYTPAEGEEKSSLEGYSHFTDESGNSILIFVSPYANFATSAVPTEPVSVQGILYLETVEEDEKQFVIKPRFKDDISTIDSAF